jgi:predicted secreted Zn-dependent protease
MKLTNFLFLLLFIIFPINAETVKKETYKNYTVEQRTNGDLVIKENGQCKIQGN